ncbi:hypothetical protein N1851_033865 [Merluccius polli]|uniref:Uncharacterized protein n=1 Tax=Merluccius polli TaxID=89951 RepID=A0AA47M0S4_MERPO|nr:hypothetical protein N1851_033865 [Merluccius polli]
MHVGFLTFAKIAKILVVSQKVSFIVELYTAWYIDHLRCYELCRNDTLDISIVDPQNLNDYTPLSLYTIQGKHYVSAKAFLLNMLFRGILAPEDIRRLQIESLPETLDAFINILKRELNLDAMLIVQYEDPTFGNELCNLTRLTDLPEERATLRIFQKHLPVPSNEPVPLNEDQLSDSTLDTASLPSTSSGESTPRRVQVLPDPFVIPKFPTDVELRLKRGNDSYFRDGSLLEVPRSMSSDILEGLAEALFAIKTHPTHGECAIVAKALVDKFPCLKEAGSTCGWYAWK